MKVLMLMQSASTMSLLFALYGCAAAVRWSARIACDVATLVVANVASWSLSTIDAVDDASVRVARTIERAADRLMARSWLESLWRRR